MSITPIEKVIYTAKFKLVSTSPVSSAKSPKHWWTGRTRSVHIPKPRTATSTL
jgi:hypothetical protein